MNPRTSKLIVTSVALSMVAAACGDSDEGAESAAGDCAVGETDGDLALYNWAEYIDPAQLEEFETEFGVSVTQDIYDSNEAMQPIIAAGSSGYDLIVPSDYMVGIMIDGGFIQPLNKDLIPNLGNISEDFSGLIYDENGDYSVPYQWGFTGLAVDLEVVGDDFPRSWDIVFGDAADEFAGKITLLNDPRETLGAALKSLGYSLNTTDEGELAEAQELLASSVDNLLAFNTDSSDQLLTSGESAVAQTYSGGAITQFLEMDDPSRYTFFVPEEGGTRWIDNMAIPFDAPHPCTAHAFINFLLDGENGADLANYTYYGTPNAASLPLIDDDLNAFLTSPDLLAGGLDSVETLVDTGEFELNFSDAFTEAKG